MSVLKEIPSFQYPAHKYADRLQRYFDTLAIDFTVGNNNQAYAAAIIAKLPYELLPILPAKASVKVILKCLTEFDGETDTLSSLVQSNAGVSDVPSLRFATQVSKLKATMDPNATDDIVKEIAWATVCNTLSATMRPFLCVMDIKRSPTDVQLKNIDKVYREISDNSEAKICATTSSEETNAEVACKTCAAVSSSSTRIEDRVAKLEQSMDKLLNMQENMCNTMNRGNGQLSNTYRPYNRGYYSQTSQGFNQRNASFYGNNHPRFNMSHYPQQGYNSAAGPGYNRQQKEGNGRNTRDNLN